jgi:hypothetical protein
MGPKVTGIPTLGISGLPLGSTSTIWMLVLWLAIEAYKGEGCGFPQMRAMVSLVSPSLPVARPSTKSAQAIH